MPTMSGEACYEQLRKFTLAELAEVLHQASRVLRNRGVKDAPWQLNAAQQSIHRWRATRRDEVPGD